MGGGMDHGHFPSFTKKPRTILLMGHSGNGKSATSRSILGKPGFESGVTSAVECQTTTLANGKLVRVIDTPGLFSCKDIPKCINLTKDGIHAILLVFSLRRRHTEEEAAAIQSLCTFFGPKITDYMILVFTGGDCLEEDKSFDDYLGPDCPESLQKLLQACKNRCVIFDNKTENELKKTMQLLKLFNLLDEVRKENGGKPYTFKEAAPMHQQQKEEANSPKGHMKQQLMDDEQLKRIMEMVECKLRDSNKMLQQELADERAARSNAEKIAQDAQKQSDDEIQMLRKNFLYSFAFFIVFYCFF